MRGHPFVVISRRQNSAMKYMVMITGNDDDWDRLSEPQQQSIYQGVRTWWDEHSAAGEILDGYQLQPTSTATTVRRSPSGEVTVTDGPFIEAKETVGGYGIIDVPDLDAAIRLVSSWPGGANALEIRPVIER
jgi:hypothetical protein